jgi:ketosteroid isomerase-like protein
MSRENVEVVRRIFDAWSQGDFSVGADVIHPEIRVVWLSVLDAGEDETRGVEAAVARLASWVTNWEHPTLTAERIVEAGDEVAVIAVWRARGEGSGVASEWRHGAVWTFRDGKVIEAVSYPDPAAAFEALGLSE